MARNVMSSSSKSSASTKAKGRLPTRPPVDDDLLESDSEVDEFAEDYVSGDEEEASGDDSGLIEYDRSEDEEGVAQWAPDDWEAGDESEDSEDEDASDNDEQDAVRMRKLQKDLTSLPLSTLLKAQQALKYRRASSDDFRSPSPDTTQVSAKEQRLAQIKAKLADLQRQKGKGAGIPYSSNIGEDDMRAESSLTAKRRDKERRAREEEKEAERKRREHKHAPMAMSSKKQVSRARQVVEVKKVERRDPRFNSLSAGQVDLHLHTQSYQFLPSLLKEEMSQLRQAISIAQKAERTCTLAEKPAKTEAREALEAQMGKLRTRLERGERSEREREALSKAKREEREKRKSGKGAWYMKDSEKRDLLLKARFNALEASGGKTAVKKAVEKKQKKIAGKEKKSRPFARGQGGFAETGRGDDGPRKRRRAG